MRTTEKKSLKFKVSTILIIYTLYLLYIFIYNLLIIIDTSLWKRIRVIIIGLKYSGENKRALDSQIIAHEIQDPKFPQLGKFKLILFIFILLFNKFII